MTIDRPQPGKQYRLTGGKDSIAGGASWAGWAVDPTDAERRQAAAEAAPKPQPGPFDDLEPISTYTADQAVDDGTLVEAAPTQYGPAVLFTRGVFEAAKPDDSSGRDEQGIKGERTYLQRAIPLIQDALMICKAQPNRDGEPEHLWTKGLEGNVTGQDVWIARNERGGITLMFPEDY